MKTIIIAVTLLIALLPFSANAGLFGKDEWQKEDCPKNHSLAWCLTDYQGRSKGIYDMSQEEFITALKKAGVTDESQIGDIIHSGIGVGAGIGLVSMGSLFGGGVFMLHALMPDEVDRNKGTTYMVFFDEGDQKRSQKEVDDAFKRLTQQAMKNSLSTLPKEAKIVDIEEGVLKIEMPGFVCNENLGCIVKYGSTKYSFPVEKKTNLPSYLGGNSVISPKPGITIGISWYNLPSGINYAALAKSISESLPTWVYWYIPEGHLGGNPLPMFLNQGKALFFVKPSTNEALAVLPHVAEKLKSKDKPVAKSTPATSLETGLLKASSIPNQ